MTSVNDAPAGADNTVSTLEDTDLVFNDGPLRLSAIRWNSDSLANVIIAAAPSNGTLYDDVNSNGTVDGGETLGAMRQRGSGHDRRGPA